MPRSAQSGVGASHSATGRRRPPNAGKGRPKGVQNKATTATKEALALAFQGLGGVPALTEWARQNQTEFYKIWSRLIPTEVSGPNGGPIEHEVRGVIQWGGVEVPL